ncbi:sushi domain-containing protein 3-like [Myxocyprinus asiaticus]|uniref:sushi domain-containing protein 3-like n=1 Tax=Myxocyprinus asiaticus TaxID=70543 RepID=UPI00222298DD|nr:sushi domain-containing protein 3-like [Myxocyprinus asiaticus]
MAFNNASVRSESAVGDWRIEHNQTGLCAPLLSPVIGSLKLVSGDGTSVGTVMTLQCPSRHRAVSGSHISCVWSSNSTHWIGGTPECKPLSRFEDEGFRLALLISFISTAIVLFMSIIFITSCLVSLVRQDERKKMKRARKREEAEFWQQIDIEGLEQQTEGLHKHKTRNNNNNNSTRGERQHTGTSTTVDNQTFTYSDLHIPCRCHQQASNSQNIQLSLKPNPPADNPTNTHITHIPQHCPLPLHCNSCVLTVEDRHFYRMLHKDQRWNGQHLFSPPAISI